MKSELESTNMLETPEFLADNHAQNSIDQAAGLLKAGIELAKTGSREEARKLLLKVVDSEPANETAWLWLASISEYPEELLGFLQKVLAINPINSRAIEWQRQTQALLAKTLVQRGITANQEGKKTLAIQFMKQSLDYEPRNTDSWMWLAAFSDSPEEKLQYFQKVLDVDPENETVRLTVKQIKTDWAKSRIKEGNTAAVSGERARAHEILQEVMSFDSNCEDAWLLKAYLSETFAEKIAAFERVVEVNPKNDFALTSLRSLLSMAQPVPTAKPVIKDEPKVQAVEEFSDGMEDEDSVLEYLSDLEKNAQNKVSEVESSQTVIETSANHLSSVEDDLLDLVDMPNSNDLHSGEDFLNDENLFVDLVSKSEVKEAVSLEAQTPESESEMPNDEIGINEVSFTPDSVSVTNEESNESAIFKNEDVVSLEATHEPSQSYTQNEFFESVAPTDELDVKKFDEVESSENAIEAQPEQFAPTEEANSDEVIASMESVRDPFADDFFVNPHFDVVPRIPIDSHIVVPEIENLETVRYERPGPAAKEAAPTEEKQSFIAETVESVQQPEPVNVEVVESKAELSEVREMTSEPVVQDSVETAVEIEAVETQAVETQAVETRAVETQAVETKAVDQLESKEEFPEETVQQVQQNEVEALESTETSAPFVENPVQVESTVFETAAPFIENTVQVESPVLETAILQAVPEEKPQEVAEPVISAVSPTNAFSNVVVTTQVVEKETVVPEQNLHCKTILVVDDSPTIRKLVTNKLEKCGHRVLAASDGMDALAILNSETPDLVLLDITMPRLDGYQVCKLIRGNHLTRDLPVVLISGKDGFFDKVRGRMAGSTAYITKPFGPDTLVRAVETYVL